MSQKLEKRSFEVKGLEVRKDGGKSFLRGHAAVFDKLSVDLGGFREYVRSGAFTRTIAEDDIRSIWNHNHDLVLGRNRANTLSLAEDKDGLAVEIELPDTQAGRDALVSISRGDVSQMSFSFRTLKDRWFIEDEQNRRELLDVKLYEVSPVTFPAYPDTDISAGLRSLGVDLDKVGQVLARAQAGAELRSDDSALLDAALEVINKFRGAKVPQKTPREAGYDRLRRELALIEAQ